MFKDDDKHETCYCENCLELQEKLQTKEQECEELRKQLDRYLNQEEEDIRQLNNDNKLDDILLAIKKANDQIEKESKYKQALDKIEDIADDYNRVEKTSQYYRDGFDEIQDIINKAKE